MKALVIYDSSYGNTARIARAVADASGGDALHVSETNHSDFTSMDLLIVGSPTQGGRPTAAIQEFLRNIPPGALQDIDVAAFDTRFSSRDHAIPLRLLMRVIGYAAGRIASDLVGKGGRLVTPPEGFIVDEKEGPLKHDEIERAGTWAMNLIGRIGQVSVHPRS